MKLIKFCPSCGQDTIHNPSGKADGSPRCTYCGFPVKTNQLDKKEYQEGLRKRQVAKLGKLI